MWQEKTSITQRLCIYLYWATEHILAIFLIFYLKLIIMTTKAGRSFQIQSSVMFVSFKENTPSLASPLCSSHHCFTVRQLKEALWASMPCFPVHRSIFLWLPSAVYHPCSSHQLFFMLILKTLSDTFLLCILIYISHFFSHQCNSRLEIIMVTCLMNAKYSTL